ncbi:MAG: hypothetical protein P8009_10150, partial [Gammaproteobacteria bacterium]
MTDHTISYASFTRRVAGNRVRERFELLVEETPQGYTLIRQLHEESYGSPFPVRTEKSYYSLADVKDKNIEIFLGSKLKEVKGYIGNYNVKII